MASEKWLDQLKAGMHDEAIEELKHSEAYRRIPASLELNIGVAHMWAEDYQAALMHFRAMLPRAHRGDIDYGMAGSAAWCLGQEEIAVDYWKKGVDAPYAIAGANTRTPLLLFMTSMLKPEMFSRNVAQELLVKKSVEWQIKNWPGPIAEFILGKASEETARKSGGDRETQGQLWPHQAWQFSFYKLLSAVVVGEMSPTTLKGALRTAIDVSGSECLEGLNFFDFLRLEEFYVARHFSRS